MKLLEVAPDFVKSQAGVLMTILQYLESKTKPGTKIPMQNVIPGVQIPMSNISKLMNNAGYSFSYENLQELIDSNPALDKMISDFNEYHIILGEKPVVGKEPNASDAEKEASTVDKMAKSAAKF